MKDKIARVKKFVRERPLETGLMVGSVIGAAAMHHGLKDRLVPSTKTAYLFAPENIAEGLVEIGGHIEFETDAGTLLLTALNPK